MAQKSVFATEELLSMILSHLSAPECARILRVDRAFFERGADRVWGELSSPAGFFLLFCKGGFSVSARNRIARGSWESSRQYAKRVRKVTNFPEAYCEQSVRWTALDNLLSRAPVADDVRTIEVSWGLIGDSHPAVGDLVKLLLGPRTSRLKCIGSAHPGLAVDEARTILERAEAAGSDLTDLVLTTEEADHDEALVALALQIGRFEQLVSVDLGDKLVRGSMLDRMRDLPFLRHLGLSLPPVNKGQHLWNFLTDEDDWTGQPFPSLRSLQISQSPCAAILRFLSARPSLLGGLTKLRLSIFRLMGDHRNAGLPESFPPLVELIASRAAALEDLSIWFPDSAQPYALPPRLLARLFSLDLRSLAVHTARLPLSSGLALIDGKWPSLSDLVMPYQPAWPADLLLLAKREALRRLVVDVKAPGPGDEISISELEVESSTVPMRLGGRFNMGEVGGGADDEAGREAGDEAGREAGEKTTETMARFLLRCWPRVSLAWRNRSPHYLFAEPSDAGYEALSKMIDKMRGYRS
ncbi:hypothetical protein FRC12_014465 [Ceratobasidium sp. 428]|nr:hypothetical protein FRC12_014465 [Ceratobasidium sp. 428]